MYLYTLCNDQIYSTKGDKDICTRIFLSDLLMFFALQLYCFFFGLFF